MAKQSYSKFVKSKQSPIGKAIDEGSAGLTGVVSGLIGSAFEYGAERLKEVLFGDSPHDKE